MASRTICEGAAFRGLKNPYTGEAIEVEMVIPAGGTPLFHSAKRTYSTSDTFPTFEAAREAWDRVDGVSGLKGPSAPMVCAYTGAPLRPVHTQAGVRLEGGFDPNLLATRDEFLVCMRGEAPQPRVAPVRRAEPRRRRSAASGPSQEAIDIAVSAAESSGVKVSSGAVSMHVPRKRR